MDEILTSTALENLPLSESEVFNLINNTNVHVDEFIELADQLIVNFMTNDPNANLETVWDQIQSAASGVDFQYDRIDDTLSFLNNDLRVSNTTKIEINTALSTASTVSAATLSKVSNEFNATQTTQLQTIKAAIVAMNNIWTNFGGQLATAIPPFFTNEAVANLLRAEIDIQTVIDNLNVVE